MSQLWTIQYVCANFLKPPYLISWIHLCIELWSYKSLEKWGRTLMPFPFSGTHNNLLHAAAKSPLGSNILVSSLRPVRVIVPISLQSFLVPLALFFDFDLIISFCGCCPRLSSTWVHGSPLLITFIKMYKFNGDPIINHILYYLRSLDQFVMTGVVWTSSPRYFPHADMLASVHVSCSQQ